MKSNQGFTLIELLIYFALVSLLFIQLTSLFLTVLEAKKDAHATSAVERDGQFMLARLIYDVQRADDVILPATLGQQTNELHLSIDGIPYVYNIVNDQLTLTRGSEVLSLSSLVTVSDFSATRLGNVGGQHTVRISVTVTSPIQEASGQETRVYQTTVGIR